MKFMRRSKDFEPPPPVLEHTALLLPGGGARAAYQVGVIKGLAEVTGNTADSPFKILCGTSAGAINAIALATQMQHFAEGSRWLESLWLDLDTSDIYRSDLPGLLANGARLIASLFNDGIAIGRPVALLNNSPLRELLADLEFDAIGENINAGRLSAVSIAAMNYTDGESVSFFQGGPEAAKWQRWHRKGVPTLLQLHHLLASTAIPTLFPPEKIGKHFFGDGALRQLTPLSPAIHLGADRVIVVPASGHRREYQRRIRRIRPPSMGQIVGHLLNSAFHDSINTDLERLERLNYLISHLPPDQQDEDLRQLRPVDTLVISPSEDIDTIAHDYAKTLPLSMRLFVRSTGSDRAEAGVNVASYLMFTRPFIQRLVEMGHSDALKQREQILSFMGLESAAVAPPG